MADKSSKPTGEDKALRKARDQFDSPKVQTALNAAILSVPDATVFDSKRIITQLSERLRDFRLGKMAAFKPAAIAWVKRQAQLAVNLRTLLQEPNDHDVKLLLHELPRYAGDVDDLDTLRAWAASVMQIKADAPSQIPGWVEQYRKLIYRAIWDELGTCLDLGVGGYDPVVTYGDGTHSRLWHPVIEEIASDVWLWVSLNAFGLVTSPVPISSRLWGKANRAALLWKLARLDDRDMFVSQTTLDLKRHRLERLEQVEDRSTLTERERELLGTFESIGSDDLESIDRAFAGIESAESKDALADDGAESIFDYDFELLEAA